VAVAVNVTLVPAHMVVADATIEIVGLRLGFTTMVKLLLVAVGEVVQAILDVSRQVTTSLLFKVVEVNVVELVPAFVPLIFHW